MKKFKLALLSLILTISGMLFADRTILFREDFEDETVASLSASSIPFVPEGSGADWDNSLWNPNSATIQTLDLTNSAVGGNSTNKYNIDLTTAGSP